MNEEMSKTECFFSGLILGIVITAFVWCLVAGIVEEEKIRTGYLTHQDRVYKVTLFDTLDTPEQEKPK